MRLLPDKPNLDFLRKEAKDLLAALRESSPQATLAEAQRALAVQYGMRDWSELKSEAVARAARAPAAPEGLAEALAETFGLGSPTEPLSPVSFTPMGRSWSLITDRGRWLAVTLYPWITEAHAQEGDRLREAAVATGVKAPNPVRSPKDRLIENVHSAPWRVHEWTDVGPSPVVPARSDVARRIGAIYGTLHSLALPSDAPINPYLTWRNSAQRWEELLDRARAAGKPWAEQLHDALPGFFDLQTIEPDDDAHILCNCNLIPENVRTAHHDELVVTEWNFAGALAPRVELGSALLHWTLRPLANPKTIAAFRDGYAEAAGRWPTLGLASFSGAVNSWLNWTYGTICEAIDPETDDLAAFAERETTDLLGRPLTRDSLQELITTLQG
jgi:hypothetical protein